MKRQYLGDSKDCFKWDYLAFLVKSLRLPLLKIVWMMTPDDGSTEGSSRPNLFPANEAIIDLCHRLRSSRRPELITELPRAAVGHFEVDLHDPHLLSHDRRSYFLGVTCASPSVVFLDPDNGFEPRGAWSERHVRFAEVDQLLRSLPYGSVITVFQHFRRKSFVDDFAEIRMRLLSGHSTAAFWHSLMFVSLSACAETAALIAEANRIYAQTRPITAVA